MATSAKETTVSEAFPGEKDLQLLIERVKNAQKVFSLFSQEKVDEIFRAAAIAANNARITLAQQAVQETGMGIVEDKVIKNHFATEYIYNKYKSDKTCGIVEHDKTFGIEKIAEPIGVVCGIIPTTNPTSTAIFKALIALKTRNAIIFSPHPRAKTCTCEAARIIRDAAVKAGAPHDIVGWIDEPTLAKTEYLMKHPLVDIILATGGPAMVKSAYSSGKPAIGVGSGNTPALIDSSADIKTAVSSILMSKTFDNGVVCASEQAIICLADIYDAVKTELIQRGAYFLTDGEKKKLGAVILDPQRGTVNPAIVGQPAERVAQIAGFKVPAGSKVLIGEVTDVSTAEPFAHEKLSPVLGMYKCSTFKEGTAMAETLVAHGGFGHTSVLYVEGTENEKINLFSQEVKTSRVLLNMPASQGAIGDIYNFRLEPSLTLGCGSWGNNSVSENVGPKHLLNIKTVAARRENMLWFKLPPKIYFKYGCLPIALQELEGKKRAFIITDSFLFNSGMVEKVTETLDQLGIESECFHQVKPDPTLQTINAGMEALNAFKPDVLIGLGGGSPMDAAKIMWLLYEHPEVKFEGLALRFMDIRKRIYTFPNMGKKAQMVCIPTTSGTGSEVTPFSIITDETTGMKWAIADYSLTPSMAIVDSELAMGQPKGLTVSCGLDVLTHALEALASSMSSDYTNGLSLEAMRVIFKYLPRAYHDGQNDKKAREKVHNASTIAGMAFANAFLGVCHSMAHKLGARFHVPHGMANALLLTNVILYNATDVPTKQASFPQYEFPSAVSRYARAADYINMIVNEQKNTPYISIKDGATMQEKVEDLVSAIEKLKNELDVPKSIKEWGVNEEEFLAAVDELSVKAFDDQCTGTNPRYPLISEIKQLYLDSFYGRRWQEQVVK
ncbi:bifunctional acetaldehyde-CoA/alcohol dehydrogenase [Parasphaerochaeta coccoides]|uniref:Aldehyde-alcohol dehydrogenase n=1 Tax=Parasphaerochaeta coccoides (strain ATCC BAA-1237 / DSM 17374 / SPN1) TaxID=760011 RepID=F4GHN6_PARC1|nr:bifunctional acetaldehyde-CoA/alcohol dehydrogenase [Parasphaerochaeta coccoides]AEC01574.1 alcohol dehydrogenase AdhE; acetaldehyde dehydrogenase [Parasphaerochaeta coccoides DSM 17374]